MEETTKPKPLAEMVRELYEDKHSQKKKKFRLPRKGKVSKGKIKKGFMTIMRIDDNGNVAFEKQRIKDATYQLSTGDYHTSNKEDILSYKGKPFVIQPTKKINPYNPNTAKTIDEKVVGPLEGENETYGQKYIRARMLADTIKVKGKGGSIIIWLLIGGAVLFGINYFMGGA